jgi:uncharacterized protein (DUF427 family)
MTDQSFDNFFKEKLKDHSAPVPEGLWEKIRPEKEKKPMKATWNGVVIAESDDTVVVEGNHYFPESALKRAFFTFSNHKTM